jgi:hypothetical protein
MSASNVEKLQQYVYRQYELEEGSVEENLYALFAEDAVIQQGEGRVMTAKDLVRTAIIVRQTPKSERIVEVSDISEDGDTITYHMRARFRNPETGELAESESDNVLRFNGQGKVVESRSKPRNEAGVLYRLSGAGGD